MIGHFAESHYACAGLFQIFVSRNLGQHGRLQLGHDSLRRPGSGEQAGEKTQNRNEDDRHNRFRRHPGDQSIRNDRGHRLQGATREVERLAQDEGEHHNRRQKQNAAEHGNPKKMGDRFHLVLLLQAYLGIIGVI